jgi:uncharacterized protein YigA (DUF484 family)
MKAEEVARYLEDNPAFFAEHAELLSSITVPHPCGGGTISLADRQLLASRDKNKALEAKLGELIQFGEENDAISEKLHRLCLALLSAPAMDALLSALFYNLHEDFAVPNVALRVCGAPRPELCGAGQEFQVVSDEVKNFAASLVHPYCGPSANLEAVSWLGEAAPRVRSVAFMPLREPGAGGSHGACFGMLVLGSEEAPRFYSDMGTLYLSRLADLASAGLARFF